MTNKLKVAVFSESKSAKESVLIHINNLIKFTRLNIEKVDTCKDNHVLVLIGSTEQNIDCSPDNILCLSKDNVDSIHNQIKITKFLIQKTKELIF